MSSVAGAVGARELEELRPPPEGRESKGRHPLEFGRHTGALSSLFVPRRPDGGAAPPDAEGERWSNEENKCRERGG